MTSIRRHIPSLSALTVFEAAARHMSFTGAAGELGVSQAAVSRRIQGLESSIGAALFVRANRTIELTSEGRLLYDTTDNSLSALERTIAAIHAMQDKSGLMVGATLAFSHFRLLPALARFRDTHPELTVQVISQDPVAMEERTYGQVAFRYGIPPFNGFQVAHSLPDKVVPMCSPDFANEHNLTEGSLTSFEPIADLPLISSEVLEPSWLTWDEWCAQRGWTAPKKRASFHFSNYSDAAYAAINGDGITLGWTCILERPLADGRLIALDHVGIKPKGMHHLLISDGQKDIKQVKLFQAWAAEYF